MAKVNITSPVGRIVMGSLYDPNTTDAEGNPLVTKTGPNAGQPRVNYFFALAIPKGTEGHWANTAWGQQIWGVGHQAFPQAAQAEDFSWKIIDGDSQKPGKLFKGKPGKKPSDNEGWPGNWIVKFSGSFAPKVYQQADGAWAQILTKDFCKPGYFVEVAFSVEGNGSSSQPGVYMNHSMVAFRGFGPEISFGPDVAAAGFGQAALPVGASLTPPPGAIPMPQAPQSAGVPVPGQVPGYAPAVAAMPAPPMAYAATAVPAIPGVPSPLPPAGSVPAPYVPAVTAPAPIPVIPNPGFIQVPPPVQRQMTALAQGTYQDYIAKGWSDVLLVQNGLMLA